jgi:hypothetical protein
LALEKTPGGQRWQKSNLEKHAKKEKQQQQGGNLGQQEARQEKEKETELSRMGETSEQSEAGSKD